MAASNFTSATASAFGFPLIQLPRKSEVDVYDIFVTKKEVSINSTSEEVRRVGLRRPPRPPPLVSINSTSEEVRSRPA